MRRCGRPSRPSVFSYLAPQARHEWIAGARKRLPCRLEHVEKGLLGLGPELLDGEIHAFRFR